MSLIPKVFLESIVAIGIWKDNSKKEKKWIATGFLVGRKEKGENEYSVFLITNKHVFQNQTKVLIRFNQKENLYAVDFEVEIVKNSKLLYTNHPRENIDISGLKIVPEGLIKNDCSFGIIPLDKNALTIQEMKENGVDEGSIVYSLGFPMSIVEENRKTPICRMGCISRISNNFTDSSVVSFLVDTMTFPGNSGGPIICKPEFTTLTGTNNNPNARLIGILNSYLFYEEQLVSTQTNVVMVKNRQNSGLTNVFPVDFINEVVELENNRWLETNNQVEKAKQIVESEPIINADEKIVNSNNKLDKEKNETGK